jgi:hypothetical protein
MHPISITREETMVSGLVKSSATIHAASLTFAALLQRQSYGTMMKAMPKLTTAGVKKIKGLSVIKDRAYA